MTAPFREVQERWKTFLEKIENRFHEILSQTEIILPNIIELQNFDVSPFGIAWQGIETQCKELIGKIQDTWFEKVSPAFDEARDSGESEYTSSGADRDIYYEQFYEQYNKEQEKAYSIPDRLEKELFGYQIRTFSTAARKLHKKAKEVLGKEFLCTQCHAPLPIKENFFRSYYETCGYCQRVNTFEPGTIARMVEHFALHPLAEEVALPYYFKYIDIEKSFRSQRDDESQNITPDNVLAVYTKYAEAYLKARIQIIPDYEKNYQKDLDAKVEHIRRWISGGYGWTNNNDSDHYIDNEISREEIEQAFWNMMDERYPDHEDMDIREDSFILDFEKNLNIFEECLAEFFDTTIENMEDKTMGEIISCLYEQRDKVNISEYLGSDKEDFGDLDE